MNLFRVTAKDPADAKLVRFVQEFMNSIQYEIVDDVAKKIINGSLWYPRDFQHDCMRWEDDGGSSEVGGRY